MTFSMTDDIRSAIRHQATAAPSNTTNRPVNRYRFNRGRVHKSDALGVNPDQVDEYREHLKKHGIAADVFPDGRVGIESEKQWKEIAKAGGLWNGRDGFSAYDNKGRRIMTGREQGKGREALRRQLANEARGYPAQFPAHLQRSDSR